MKTRTVMVGLLCVVVLSSFQAIAQETRYVDNLADCAHLQPCYTTVQSAVDDAQTGDTVSIFAGVYRESVTLSDKDHLTLRARDLQQKPVIAGTLGLAGPTPSLRVISLSLGAESGRGIAAYYSGAIDGSILGNTIVGGILANRCFNAVIQGNLVIGGGIQFGGGSVAFVASEGCDISRNTFVNGGINMVADADVTGNTIRSNSFDHGGILLSGRYTSSNQIVANVLESGGINLSGRAVRDNQVRGNTVHSGGIVLWSANGNDVGGNFVSASPADGIQIYALVAPIPNRIHDNTSVDNAECDVDDLGDPDTGPTNIWARNRFRTACGAAH